MIQDRNIKARDLTKYVCSTTDKGSKERIKEIRDIQEMDYDQIKIIWDLLQASKK